MPVQKSTDVMQLFVILTTSIFGPSMADIIGPYLLIVFAAATGAAWSLGRCRPQGKAQAFFYFVRIMLIAVLLTVAISQAAAAFMPSLQEEWLIAPVALIIGLIGDDWYKIGEWFINLLKRLIEKKLDKF